MKKINKAIGRIAKKVTDSFIGSGLSQDMTIPEGQRYITPGMPEMVRKTGAESCVLLKNDGVLPLDAGNTVAVFGRCQLDWFYVGYGSGGDVHAPYKINLIDGLKNAGARLDEELAAKYYEWTHEKDNLADDGWWGHWPFSYPEMPVSPELAQQAAGRARTAVVVIGRAAGEDRENTLTKGSYYLTDLETGMLDAVTSAFEKTVVLMNTGNITDMSWTEKYGDRISAVMIVWQGGMESGNAVADVLFGKVSPSGKLPDSIARYYEDYPSSVNFGGKEYNDYDEDIFVGYRYFGDHPEKLLWPFGYGLSYSNFEIKPVIFSRGTAEVSVRNTGGHSGKEVVQLWCAQPPGRLPKAKKILAAFAKTPELAPGESCSLELAFTDRDIASYDGTLHAFVLEAGKYCFDVNGTYAGNVEVAAEEIIEQCLKALTKDVDLKKRIIENLPENIPQISAKGIMLSDVKKGRVSLEEFVAQLDAKELEALTRGHGMIDSRLGAPGNAGVFGGILPSLRDKGIEPLTCCDGPAGIRMKRYCSLIPCGTALAATWNTELIRDLHVLTGREMAHYGVDIQLGPGMNIHRNPLCGRNFEYFSEDPLLSGKVAAAVINGVQSTGKASCPKHFACNNQETRRNTNDSRVSERALREIYLRSFEIAVREAKPFSIMTSYNKINGVWSHYNYDLATTVLRKEWGFEGCVMTDWWMKKSVSPEFSDIRDNAYRVRAQVDVLMPGDMGHLAKGYRSDGTLLSSLGKPGGITLGELQRSAENVLRLVMKLKDD